MWCLLMILLVPIPGLHRVTVLQQNLTEQQCGDERNRIGFEMAEAYPYERDFVIACSLDRKVVT